MADNLRIAVVCDVRGKQVAAHIAEALQAKGYFAQLLVGSPDFLPQLRRLNPDLVFNYYSGTQSRAQQLLVPALLESAGIPFTGSSVLSHTLALHKDIAHQLFAFAGIPTPRFQVFTSEKTRLSPQLKFPLIVKPVHEGSSMGISPDAVVTDHLSLQKAVERVLTNFHQPALVSEYIAGREFTVAVLGNRQPRVLPPAEIDFQADGRYDFYSYKVKENNEVPIICPAQISNHTIHKLQQLALRAYRTLRCYDYARMDFRLGLDGCLYLLEVNTLPGLKPGYSDFPRMAEAGGFTYKEILAAIVDAARERYPSLEIKEKSTLGVGY